MSSTFRGFVLQDELTGCNDIDDTWRNSYNKVDCISVELLQRGMRDIPYGKKEKNKWTSTFYMIF